MLEKLSSIQCMCTRMDQREHSKLSFYYYNNIEITSDKPHLITVFLFCSQLYFLIRELLNTSFTLSYHHVLMSHLGKETVII